MTSLHPKVRARMVSFCNERSGHLTKYDQGASFWLPNMTWLGPAGWVHAMNYGSLAGGGGGAGKDGLGRSRRALPISPASPPLFPSSPLLLRPAASGTPAAAWHTVCAGAGSRNLTSATAPPLPGLVYYSASILADGSAVFLHIVNANPAATANVTVLLPDFLPAAVAGKAAVLLLEAGGDLNATNSPAAPFNVSPRAAPVQKGNDPVGDAVRGGAGNTTAVFVFSLPPYSYAVANFTY